MVARMDREGWGGLGLPSRPSRLARPRAELPRPDPAGRRSGVPYHHGMGFGLGREKAGGVLDRLAC